jgi:hypothetical protein
MEEKRFPEKFCNGKPKDQSGAERQHDDFCDSSRIVQITPIYYCR